MKTPSLSFALLLIIACIPLWTGAQRVLGTERISETITLDGQLNENCWLTLPVADSFIVNYPNIGELSGFHTEARFAYDDLAIYVGVKLDDPRADSVLAMLSQRDDYGNADWFAVLIDPYGAGQNGFNFSVTAAGVELDAIITQREEDFSWNAVWKSRVARTATGWSLEIRIPLSQLRFPETEVQNWRINFKRQVRRIRQMSYWSPVDPQKYGEIAQSGSLIGLAKLVSPLRLSFSPYTTAYVENYYNSQTGIQEWRFRQRFGMDVKYGLSESFTLDATLVPDFGQTVSDNLVLNLTPFEVRYNENRPFFLEGMDLFGIGDLFYTRRIGAATYRGAQVVDSLTAAGTEVVTAPSQAQLINATKISGRTGKGLGVGVFNAIEKRSTVTYRDSTGAEHEILAHPLTNYNVFVLSRNLNNNNNISLLNTNVYRPELNMLANVSTAEATVFSKKRKYSLFVSGRASVIEQNKTSTAGHTAYAKFEKVQGPLTWYLDYYETSDTFDPNDLGFLPRNNFRGFSAFTRWIGYQPKGRFLRRTLIASTNLEYLYNPDKFAYWVINGRSINTFRNFLSTGLEFDYYPLGQVDHFESRTFGNPVIFPASFMLGGFYSSDYSKKYALDFSVYNRFYLKAGMNDLDAEISPRIRLSNKLFTVFGTGISRYLGNYGYVRVADTNYTGQIILGVRDRWIVNNSISADYTFTNRMGLTLRLNHYWQEVNYSEFRQLQPEGRMAVSSYTGIRSDGSSAHNTSFNAFTIDLSYRWVIYPGSEIRFVWKYNIYASKNALDENYFYTFRDLFEQPQLNSFSVKALFFLDAGKVKRKNRP